MDIQYLLLLQEFREMTHGMFDRFFLLVTSLGGGIAFLVPLAIYWCVNKEMGIRTMFAFYGGRMLNGILKLAACVYRPWIRSGAVHPLEEAVGGATGYSFPSGHATSAAGAYGSVAWEYRKTRRVLAVSMLLIVFLVMFSRNYVGVHTPQDVLVGFAVTAVLVIFSRRLLDWVERKENRDLLLAGILAAVTAGCMVWFLVKPYPMDYDAAGNLIVDPAAMWGDSFSSAGAWIGFLVGWLVERRFINFSAETGIWNRMIRFGLGAAVFVFLLFGGSTFLQGLGIEKIWAEFFRMLTALFYCTAVHPLLFTVFEDKWRSIQSRKTGRR